MRRDEIIYSDSEYSIIRRKPTLSNLVPTALRQSSTHEKLRWLVQFLYGYRVYVLVEEDTSGSESQTEVGYCFIGDGANFRYTFAKRGDALLGPYYIAPKKRGKGLTVLLVDQCLKADPPKNGNVWGFISDDNIASKKVYQRVGSHYISDFCFRGKLRILYKCAEGEKGDMGLWYHNVKEVSHE